MAIIDECLSVKVVSYDEEIIELKKDIKKLKEEIKVLQNLNDTNKIANLSAFITDLYKEASSVSSVVEDDVKKEGFCIEYIKKGNILQPKVSDIKNGTVNYYVGSMARHTLIQLCGYLGFLDILVEDESIPIIPILVIDHISKPFDKKNCNAIGAIFQEATKRLSLSKVQIFIFDDKDPNELSLKVNNYQHLASDGKIGFNPFYIEDQ